MTTNAKEQLNLLLHALPASKRSELFSEVAAWLNDMSAIPSVVGAARLMVENCSNWHDIQHTIFPRLVSILSLNRHITTTWDTAVSAFEKAILGVQTENARLAREVMTGRIEVDAILKSLGVDAIRIREGGGPEDVYASLAVSVAKLQSKVKQDDETQKRLKS